MKKVFVRQHEMDAIAELWGYARGASSLVIRYPTAIVHYVVFEPNPEWSWT